MRSSTRQPVEAQLPLDEALLGLKPLGFRRMHLAPQAGHGGNFIEPACVDLPARFECIWVEGFGHSTGFVFGDALGRSANAGQVFLESHEKDDNHDNRRHQQVPTEQAPLTCSNFCAYPHRVQVLGSVIPVGHFSASFEPRTAGLQGSVMRSPFQGSESSRLAQLHALPSFCRQAWLGLRVSDLFHTKP
jgi:hypothetical protein